MPKVYLLGLWNEMSGKGRNTLPWDLIRGGFEGAGNVFVGTFALLIAIQHFHCSDNLKSLIAAGSSSGLAVSFLYATYSHYLIGKRNMEAAIPLFLAAGGSFTCAWVDGPIAYSVLCFLVALLFAMRAPIMTAIYRENYKRTVRGQVFGLSVLLGALSSAMLSYFGGKYLDHGIERYRQLFVFFAFLLLGAALAVLRIPCERQRSTTLPNPLSYFSVLGKDPTFVYVLVTWFIFGLANLTLLPQRFEYVSQERYGFSLSPGMVALVVAVIPDLTRVVMVIPMGRLFDRMNFIVLRILINFFFLGYMLLYFHAGSVWLLVVSSIFLGVGFAGGDISWNLWVTKFAAPADTAKYMAMHTFFNGVRGIVGPFVGYWIARRFSVPATATFCAGLIVLSLIMLLPLVPQGAPNDYKKDVAPIAEG
jgi:MFS family permease